LHSVRLKEGDVRDRNKEDLALRLSLWRGWHNLPRVKKSYFLHDSRGEKKQATGRTREVMEGQKVSLCEKANMTLKQERRKLARRKGDRRGRN